MDKSSLLYFDFAFGFGDSALSDNKAQRCTLLRIDAIHYLVEQASGSVLGLNGKRQDHAEKECEQADTFHNGFIGEHLISG